MAALHAAAFTTDRPWTEAEFRDLVAERGSLVLGDPRAFALGRVVLDEAELLTLATDPAHRRRGLARRLLIEWQEAAAARGARRVFLEVAADNAAALALYSALGYAQADRRRGYYRRAGAGACDAVLMARALGQAPAA